MPKEGDSIRERISKVQVPRLLHDILLNWWFQKAWKRTQIWRKWFHEWTMNMKVRYMKRKMRKCLVVWCEFNELRKHKRNHSKKPYSCSKCDKTFKHYGALKNTKLNTLKRTEKMISMMVKNHSSVPNVKVHLMELNPLRLMKEHTYCRVFKPKKSKERTIRIFEKPDFPVRIRIRWFRTIRGVTLRSQEVHRSEKSEKKISGKSGFPGSGSGFPDLRPCRCDRGRKGYL